MESGSGFVNDLRQASADRSAYREAVLRSVPCPTLMTSSRQDGGVAFTHAEDFLRTIPDSHLVETGAWNHFAWLGPSRLPLLDAVHDFLAERAWRTQPSGYRPSQTVTSSVRVQLVEAGRPVCSPHGSAIG